MIDDFPAMPERFCPDCKCSKKLMFFAPTSTYCRACSYARSARARCPNPVPAMPMIVFQEKSGRRKRI